MRKESPPFHILGLVGLEEGTEGRSILARREGEKERDRGSLFRRSLNKGQEAEL